MTDKQIIDVTGCKYSTFDGGCTMLKTCDNNPNCYYKQLKRKERILNNIKEYTERYLGSADRYYILKMMGEI